ncbi:T-cell activation Rho GTPase-activating protein-like [Theristicus caerulescens]
MGQVNCCRSSRDDPDPEQQCAPVLASPEPRLRQRVRVTQGRATRKRDLLLFGNALVIAKPKRGSAPRPQLCLALGQLQVLSSGKGAAGDVAEEEEGKHTNSLVLVWPCGSCVLTFPSRAVKELWVSALLGPPEGAEGAQVTQLPSIKVLLKKLSDRNAATTLHASSLDRLIEGQAEAGAEQRPPPVPSGSQGGHGHSAAGGTRRSRRGLPWPFVRRGTSAAAEAAGQSGSGGSGALFGRPLAALCSQDGTLPQPIQDLLALLHEHGPSTEGIFRLVAGERASRELREALDSGAEVHLESQPVLLLAVTLKDFLRKIPSKLLEVELYEEWMSALQKTSRQERLAALKEVASKLPKANLLLLKSLLSLLQNISRNSTTSRMTAGNLAICVGPNLLSPAEEHTLPLDVLLEETGKVTRLVEFLIEHHGELLEEEVAGLAGASAEELPAPGVEAETPEVPPVAPESKHLKSSSEEGRLPGSLQEEEKQSSRKRKLSCEEESDGQLGKKRQKLATEILGMGN